MDILLSHGFFLCNDPVEQKIMKPYPTSGLLSISAYLKEKGFAVEVFDSTFKNKRQFEQFLSASRPQVVGLYANLMTKYNVLELIRLAKAHNCTVIVGGPDPPYYAQEYLEFGADVVAVGEGEETLEKLIPLLSDGKLERLPGVAGIVYRDENGQIQRTPARSLIPNLDVLPFPDRQAINLQEYLKAWRRQHGVGAVSLITSRGCPYSCTWCSHSVFGKTLRKRSPARVAEEVDWLLSTYHPDFLWYADDVFNINHKWLYQYAAELKRRQLRVPFECICRADRMDEDIVGTLREMGCFRLWIGSESGSQRLLDAMQRGVRAEQVQAMTRLAKRHGIETGMFLMWGFTGENETDVELTIDHVKKADPDVFLTTVAYPIKGTSFFEEERTQGTLVAGSPWCQTNDREHKIKGRHSRRYFGFVNRRLGGEVQLRRLRANGTGRQWLSFIKASVNTRLGKLGMALTRQEREA